MSDSEDRTMENTNAQVSTDGALPAVRSIDWLDALRRHVDDMKGREREEAKLREEHRTRYEMVMRERMLLEDFIYKTERI